MSRKRLIAIDGNSLIFRAYYALPPLSTKSGIFTNAVYGFINMLNKVMEEYKPDYVTVAFDLKAPTFRHIEYSEYKAGRKKTPFELLQQFPLLKEVLGAMDISILEMEGFEADDLIGTVVKRGEEAGLEPYVITGDKDALQLASDITKIIITKKGMTEFDIYDDKAMMERYHMTPEQFIDLKGLMGDSSDNIPGIPGVGEKTGIALIEQFGSVANLVQNADQITKPKLREKVEEYSAQAIMSRRLAQINTNVPIEIDFENLKIENPDKDEIVKLYRKLELFSLIGKLDKTWVGKQAGAGINLASADDGSGEEVEKIELSASLDDAAEGSAGKAQKISEAEKPESGLENPVQRTKNDFPWMDESILNDQSGASEAVEYNWDEASVIYINSSEEDGFISFKNDLENESAKNESAIYMKVIGLVNHVKKPEIFGAAFGVKGNVYYIESPDIICKAMMEISARGLGIKGSLLKDDYFMLLNILPKDYSFKTAFDAGIAQYVLEPQKKDFSLKALGMMYLGVDMESEKDFYKNNSQTDLFGGLREKHGDYGKRCIAVTSSLEKVLKEQIKLYDMESVYFGIELPLIEIFADMEFQGFSVDKKALTDIGRELNGAIEELRIKIYDLVGEEFNINSPKQLGVILFEKMGMKGGKKTKTGYSTSADVLEKLKEDNEIVGLILEYRTLSKLNSTYVEGLTPLISEYDGKIRAHFQQTGTATGRISCTEPNLQNIPVRQELGRTLRKAFIADEGCVLVDADYSQIELRILAHLSQEESLIYAFNNGADIHRSTAARVFEVPEEEVTSIQRSNAKAVNFGVIYGMSGFGLSENLNISFKEAEKYIKDYFKKYSKVKEFIDSAVEFCKDKGYVSTIKGRRRDVPEIKASNYMQRQFGERLAMNSPIQGSAADIIKIAMIKVFRELRERGFRSKLILQVHDELIINTYHEELEAVKELLNRNMMEADSLAVPLQVGMDSGNSWYEVK